MNDSAKKIVKNKKNKVKNVYLFINDQCMLLILEACMHTLITSRS